MRSDENDDEDFEDDEEPLDHSPSSGATDPEHAAQDTSEDMQTGRHSYTENQTYIDGEIEANSDRWDSLNEANRQLHGGDTDTRRQKQRVGDLHNDIQMWGKRIGLTDHECDRAKNLVRLSEDGCLRKYGVETMVLSALTIAANEGHNKRNTQPRSIRPNGPETDNFIMVQTYERIRMDLDVDSEDVKSCRKHLHKKM